MAKPSVPSLSRRERQILDVIYARGRATAADVTAELPDAPTYTTVRGLLRILEEKGHVRHEEDAGRYVYSPTAPREAAGTSQLQHVVRTFFDGSAAKAMAAFLGSSSELSEAEVAHLRKIVESAEKTSKNAKRGARK
ncbi:MAG TPA: BlaI/MecI/CopY family transcriptional regulator [Gemmatimonadaceae bacterium]|nr:BlaI/MecI/CopY family transcriptional regulator [Gemmatimonadaceae bacterium]